MIKAGPKFASDWVATNTKPGVKEILIVLKQFVFNPPYSSALPQPLDYLYKLCTLLVISLLIYALLRKHRSPNLIWITAWAALPSGFIFVLSYVSSASGMWFSRYLLLVCPYVFILLAAGFIRIWRFQAVTAFAIAIIYILGIGGGLYHYYAFPNRSDWRGAIQFIEDNEQPNDSIILYSIPHYFAIKKLISSVSSYYYEGTHSFHFLSNEADSKKSLKSSQVNDLIQEITPSNSQFIAHKDTSEDQRLWVICFKYCRFPSSISGLNQAFTSNEYYLKAHREFTDRVHVFLFEPSRKLSGL